MAPDTANGITYYLSIEAIHKDYLGAIRHWSHLKIAFEENLVWVKDLNQEQVESLEVKSIPFKKLYYANDGKLFLHGSLLPSRTVPSLLWTPIERGLPIQLPAFNHNYFGIHDKASIRLVATELERPAYGLITSLQRLGQYMETAPSIRLQSLSWAILDNDEAIIIGNPVLPIQGAILWRMNDFLIPAGYELALPAIAGMISNVLNKANDSWIVWGVDGSYFKLPYGMLQPLSVGSFRLSRKEMTNNSNDE